MFTTELEKPVAICLVRISHERCETKAKRTYFRISYSTFESLQSMIEQISRRNPVGFRIDGNGDDGPLDLIVRLAAKMPV